MPDNLDPIWVASLILCDSPPLNVPAILFKFKYPNPTFIKNVNLSFISFMISFDISCSSLFNFILLKKSYKSFILKLHISYIFLFFILTFNISSFNLEPLHTSHVKSVI